MIEGVALSGTASFSMMRRVGLLRALRKHRTALLVDEIDIEFGFLDHDVLGGFSELRHVLQRLPERGCGEREGLVVFQMRAVFALMIGKPSTSITPE